MIKLNAFIYERTRILALEYIKGSNNTERAKQLISLINDVNYSKPDKIVLRINLINNTFSVNNNKKRQPVYMPYITHGDILVDIVRLLDTYVRALLEEKITEIKVILKTQEKQKKVMDYLLVKNNKLIFTSLNNCNKNNLGVKRMYNMVFYCNKDTVYFHQFYESPYGYISESDNGYIILDKYLSSQAGEETESIYYDSITDKILITSSASKGCNLYIVQILNNSRYHKVIIEEKVNSILNTKEYLIYNQLGNIIGCSKNACWRYRYPDILSIISDSIEVKDDGKVYCGKNFICLIDKDKFNIL